MTRGIRPRFREPPPPDVRELLERRAARVRQRPPLEEPDDLVWLAELTVGGERFAIPLERMRGCLPLKMVVPVPLAPPDVVGILRHHGRIVTAFSLSAILGVTARGGWAQDPRYLLVVDRGDDELVAFDCEEIPLPAALRRRAIDRGRTERGITFVTTDDARQVGVIDVVALVSGRAERRRA